MGASGERTPLAKAPLCKGSLPTVWGDVCEADRGDGASACRECETEGLFLSNSNLYNPSVIFLRKCHLPLHKGGYSYVRSTPLPTVVILERSEGSRWVRREVKNQF